MPEKLATGNSADRSDRDVQPDGTPTIAPSITTLTVPPSGGSALRLPGASTQPKTLYDAAVIVSPCAGVSIAPKGVVAVLFVQVMVLDPSVNECPSASSAIAVSLNVPLPRVGRKLVSRR